MKKTRKTEGFTLVELIIAVAILGIVISPLVANFIQSAKINKKAKISLNATNMAQDILEGASSYSADEFIKMFESEATLVNKIIPSGLTYEFHGDMDAAGSEVYKADVSSFNVSDGAVGSRLYTTSVKGGIAQDVKRVDGSGNRITDYYFFADGVKQGNNNYNLKFHLSTANSQNNKTVANIATINNTYDVTRNVSSDEATVKANEFVNRASGTKTADDYLQIMSRTITISIYDKSNDLPKSTATTKAEGNKYVIDLTKEYSVPEGNGVPAGMTAISETEKGISTLDESLLPRSIYLYFCGMPYTTKDDIKDNIVIDNRTGKEITIYLIRTLDKEKEKQDPSQEETYNDEYGASVSVVSKIPDASLPRVYTDDTVSPNKPVTHIVSNLRYDLSSDASKNIRILKEGSNSEVVDSKYQPTDPTEYKQDRCKYTYNGTAITEALYESNFSPAYQQEKKSFIYDVTLDVMDVATGNKVATFTSSLSD
ncbi:type II secretion system GspH family protein [Kineothrix sp. MSJ-39]|uniref:type IV pilus modification PilV family protein n=1 Tax=Kineothrix sp. MSJ-39 TaxID=2841533 RepID=UPI001C116C92|nr:type II secretion system protein [Kineothrix sp. MSJ-39]MBU5430208.1 type II secretion system GspH family protein [Kineothrix sp. MSJ-39]